MSPRRAAHPLWRFSLDLYGRSGVERACLGLQNDCGADVNVLLFCCWMGRRGRSLDRRALRRAIAAVRPWQENVVRPLREVRRALRRPDAAVPDAWRAHLRKSVFPLELDAEYVEQLRLVRVAASVPRPARKRDPARTAAANLARYLGLLDAPASAKPDRRLAALCEACFPG